jgi:hypothetical protein
MQDKSENQKTVGNTIIWVELAALAILRNLA